MPKLTVGAHTVTLVDRFPAKSFFPLHRLLRWYADGHYLGDRSLDEDVRPYVGTVTEWDYPGDPAQFEAWTDLDVLTELPQLIGAINTHIVAQIEQTGAEAKN